MKRPHYLIILAVIAAIPLSFFTYSHYTKTPKGAFKRHFDSFPPSVRNIERHGYAALAGSDETLLFDINRTDLDKLTNFKSLEEVTAAAHKKIKGSRRSWDDPVDIALAGGEFAVRYGITPDRYFVRTKLEGTISYVLITDQQSDRVYYNYSSL